MKTVTEQLNDIVMASVGSTALTAEALGKFVELQKQFEALTKERDTYKRDADTFQRQASLVDIKNAELDKQNQALKSRIEKAEALELQSKMDVFEKNFYLARGNEMRSILSDVFRNIQVHRNITSHIPIAPGTPNQYNSCPPSGYVQEVQGKQDESAS
jgi:hypothetical protein